MSGKDREFIIYASIRNETYIISFCSVGRNEKQKILIPRPYKILGQGKLLGR